MSHFRVFFKKEMVEHIRTYKLLIMLVVFFIFGIMNPLTAKLTPELLEKFMPEGVLISLPEPSSIDSWAQFYKNITQMGLIVTVLVFSSVLSSELSKGTLINLLTKGLSRTAVIMGKFAAMLTIWTVSLATAFVTTWGYTVFLFSDDYSANLFSSVFCLWLFGVFILAVLLCSSTLAASSYGALLLTGAAAVCLAILNIFPKAWKYNPLSLAGKNMELVTNSIMFSSLSYAIGVTVAAAIALLAAAVLIFKRKQL